MSNDISLSTFPSSKTQALTMLYLENQDLSSITPEQLADMYQNTYGKINQGFKDRRERLRSI